MMDKQNVYSLLNQAHIPYEVYEHPPVYTIEDLDALRLLQAEQIVKNLFLRDDKKRNFYLVSVPGHCSVNLKALAERIPSRKLSFASEADLWDWLRLEKGHVTPLGVLNDEKKEVTVVFDRALRGQLVGIHPMENTATIFLAFADVIRLVEEHGNPVVLCDFS
jgi:Ala-tRNA(Pro) deacylase